MRTVAQQVDKLSEEDRFKISLRDARKIKDDVAVGDVLEVITRPAGSFRHIAGTDQTGRDVLSRVIATTGLPVARGWQSRRGKQLAIYCAVGRSYQLSYSPRWWWWACSRRWSLPMTH